jgi:heme/copper-type cytochrome/quinol oxidase subunit 2
MDTRLVMAPTSRLQPLSALSKWTVATLATVVVMLIWLQLVDEFVRQYWFFALVLGTPALVATVLIVATRWRWAPLLGVLYWVLLIASALRRIPYDITHPEHFDTFAFTVVVNAVGVLGIVAGVGATVQNYRAPTPAETDNGRRRVPKWFPAVLCSLAGLCLGALLIGALPRADDTSGVSPAALAALPALRVGGPQLDGVVGGFQFDPPELRVKVGEMVALRLENRHDDLGHSFNIDEFDVHVSIPPGKTGLALFRASTPGSYTFYCGLPGHHESGTLIVEP